MLDGVLKKTVVVGLPVSPDTRCLTENALITSTFDEVVVAILGDIHLGAAVTSHRRSATEQECVAHGDAIGVCWDHITVSIEVVSIGEVGVGVSTSNCTRSGSATTPTVGRSSRCYPQQRGPCQRFRRQQATGSGQRGSRFRC